MSTKSLLVGVGLLFGALIFVPAQSASARPRNNNANRAPASDPTLETLNTDRSIPEVARSTNNDDAVNQYLGTGNAEDDLKHYHDLNRHLGVDLGMMVPYGDFQSEFAMSPMIGMHLAWEAIEPFNFVVSFLRSSAGQKTLASLAKLSITSINIGAMASFPCDRVQPFIKVEGAFLFNDLNFNDGRKIVSGNDIILTTVGINLGIGIDFIVGREVSVGLDLTYHYAIPKKLAIDDGSTFDLGSPFATAGLRVNF